MGVRFDIGPGLFVFQLRTVPYQQLQYQRNWRHVITTALIAVRQRNFWAR